MNSESIATPKLPKSAPLKKSNDNNFHQSWSKNKKQEQPATPVKQQDDRYIKVLFFVLIGLLVFAVYKYRVHETFFRIIGVPTANAQVTLTAPKEQSKVFF